MEKEQMPLVSIVVPVYHVGAYIRQCVDSILGLPTISPGLRTIS